jgi:hypothetical protein
VSNSHTGKPRLREASNSARVPKCRLPTRCPPIAWPGYLPHPSIISSGVWPSSPPGSSIVRCVLLSTSHNLSVPVCSSVKQVLWKPTLYGDALDLKDISFSQSPCPRPWLSHHARRPLGLRCHEIQGSPHSCWCYGASTGRQRSSVYLGYSGTCVKRPPSCKTSVQLFQTWRSWREGSGGEGRFMVLTVATSTRYLREPHLSNVRPGHMVPSLQAQSKWAAGSHSSQLPLLPCGHPAKASQTNDKSRRWA